MPAPWRSVSKPEPIRIISPEGDVRCTVQAFYAGGIFIVEDMKADVRPGDELRRMLPNGNDDVFAVDDPELFNTGIVATHYQVKVSRKGTFSHNVGGHFISVSGPNARVNVGSNDHSTNISHQGDVFGDIRQAVKVGVREEAKRAEILAAIDEAERTKGTGGFLTAYQKVISIAADHIGLLGPFLPALTALIPS